MAIRCITAGGSWVMFSRCSVTTPLDDCLPPRPIPAARHFAVSHCNFRLPGPPLLSSLFHIKRRRRVPLHLEHTCHSLVIVNTRLQRDPALADGDRQVTK